MLSERLAAFVAANKPKEIPVSAKQVEAWAAARGITRETAQAPWGEECPYFAGALGTLQIPGDAQLHVTWYSSVREGAVDYRPYLTGKSSASGTLAEDLMSYLGINTVTVLMPETSVTLPIPSWVTEGQTDSWPGGLETTHCFCSELEGLVRPFLGQLQRLLRK